MIELKGKAKEYVKSQAMAAGPITIATMICRLCRFRGTACKAALCDVYNGENGFKPNEVINGGDCDYFEPEM